jgi:hypothetical protein
MALDRTDHGLCHQLERLRGTLTDLSLIPQNPIEFQLLALLPGESSPLACSVFAPTTPTPEDMVVMQLEASDALGEGRFKFDIKPCETYLLSNLGGDSAAVHVFNEYLTNQLHLKASVQVGGTSMPVDSEAVSIASMAGGCRVTINLSIMVLAQSISLDELKLADHKGAVAGLPVVVPLGCNSSCGRGHYSDGNCLLCGKGYGVHYNHDCPTNEDRPTKSAVRGRWIVQE